MSSVSTCTTALLAPSSSIADMRFVLPFFWPLRAVVLRAGQQRKPFISNTFTVATSAHPRARGALAPTLPPWVGRSFGGRTAVWARGKRRGFSPAAAANAYGLCEMWFSCPVSDTSHLLHSFLNSPTLDISPFRFDPHVCLSCPSSTIFKNLMSPTPRRKWYLTTGHRAH